LSGGWLLARNRKLGMYLFASRSSLTLSTTAIFSTILSKLKAAFFVFYKYRLSEIAPKYDSSRNFCLKSASVWQIPPQAKGGHEDSKIREYRFEKRL